MRYQPAVSLLVGPLAGDNEVSTRRIERADEAIDISA
jgi:hypothetical protein